MFSTIKARTIFALGILLSKIINHICLPKKILASVSAKAINTINTNNILIHLIAENIHHHESKTNYFTRSLPPPVQFEL